MLKAYPVYTYIHNWPLQSFSQDNGLASHTTPVVYVNFIREWRNLQFKVDSPYNRLLRNFFTAGLFTLRVFARNLLREHRRRDIYFFRFHFDVQPGIRTRALCLISQHTIYQTTATFTNNRHIQGAPNTFFLLENLLKKTAFSNFCFYLKSQSFRLVMKNNFIQMAASTSHALAYTIDRILSNIIDCVQLYFTNGFTNIVL